MGDSLRDQLLNAGFVETKTARKPAKKSRKPSAKKAPRKQSKSASESKNKQIEEEAKILERKRIKAEIKSLIEAACEKEIEGDQVYSYILGNRVKQLFVNKACHEKIVNRTVAITRLNGATYLIPLETAEKVKALNPEWAIVIASDDGDKTEDSDYAEYEIPDDLQW